MLVLDNPSMHPFRYVSELLDFSELLFIVFLMSVPNLFDELECKFPDTIVLIIHARNKVWENSSFVVASVWKIDQKLSHGLIKALSYNCGSIGNKHSQIIDLGSWIVKLFDRHDVGISETNHMLEDMDTCLPHTCAEDVEECSQASHSNLLMLVNERSKKTSSHWFTKMDKLISSCLTELGNCVGSFNDNLTIWVHAKSFAYVYDIVDVRSHAIKKRCRNNNCHYFCNQNSYGF